MRRTLLLAATVIIPGTAMAVVTACDQMGSLTAPVEAGPPDGTVSGTDAAGDDGGATDSGSPGSDSGMVVMADACGAPPWVTLGIVVVGLDLSNTDGSPLPGAEFSSPLCPGVVKVSDDAGLLTGAVSADTPFYARLVKSGYVSELAPEEIFDADSLGNRVEMLPSILTGFVPGYQADAAAIVIAAQKTVDDAGACSALDGVTLGVEGLPGVTVTYFSNASIPMPMPGATATTTRGLALITGLPQPDGSLVTLTGSKPGCNVVFVRGSLTGRVPLENGFVSAMPAYVTP